jgi:hypothetical protein
MPVSPSLSTVVTRAVDGGWPGIDRFTRLSPSGLRLIPAPVAVVEAQQAVSQSARTVVDAVASTASPIALVDAGRFAAPPATHPFVNAADVTVVLHRQAPQSARAAAVRLQRLADQIHACQAIGGEAVVGVVGSAPFDLGQVDEFLSETVGAVPVVGLPVDTLAAAAYAGRAGVSARRLARLPLSRAARHLAAVVAAALVDRAPAVRSAGS